MISEPRQPQCLSMDEFADAVHVGGRIGPREGDPQEIMQRLARELAVVHDDDERKRVERVSNVDRRAESLDRGLFLSAALENGGPAMASTPGRQTRGSRNPSGKCKSDGKHSRQLAPRRTGGGNHQFRARH